jgi:two-component system, sensor histidine kinase and response regulator
MARKSLDLKNAPFYLSVRWMLLLPLLSLFIISSIVVLLLFTRAADKSEQKMMEHLSKRIETEVQVELNNYLDEALLINYANRRLIEHHLIDPYLPEDREPFFSSRLELWKGAVMSFFGDPAGEFYGARRNVEGQIEVVKNNSGTNGASRYFSINSEGRADSFAIEYPGFDCRTRPWYKAAVEDEKAVFSSVYKHFVFDDLAVTASLPVYREDGELMGVLGADYLLGSISSFLKEIKIVEEMVIFIVEDETDYVIANSELDANFFKDGEGIIKRVHPDECANPTIKEVYRAFLSGEGISPIRNNGNLVVFSRFEKENLRWDIYISIPEAFFLSDFRRIGRMSLVVIVLFILFSILLALYLSKTITGPILQLSKAAEDFARSQWSSRVPVKGHNEITRLSITFNSMAGKLQEYLETLETKVDERTAELNELNRTKDAFFAIIAHDLRGPLASSYKMLDHLLEEYQTYTPEDLAIVIRTIGDSQKSIHLLLENLLLWAQNQRNEVYYDPKPLLIDELVQEVQILFQGKAVEKGLDIRYNRTGFSVFADRNMLSTVMRNLLSNAVKYSSRGSRIDVEVSSLEGEVEIAVQDYGGGMDLSAVERLQQIDKRKSLDGTEGEKGSGLGLFITADFLARHNSSLKVDSKKGEGSRFSFRLQMVS